MARFKLTAVVLVIMLVTAGCLGFVGGSGDGSTPTATPDATASTPRSPPDTKVITVTRVVTVTRIRPVTPVETATPESTETPYRGTPIANASRSRRHPFGDVDELTYTIIMPKVPKSSRDIHRRQVFEAIDFYEDDYGDYKPARLDYRDVERVGDPANATIVIKVVDKPGSWSDRHVEGVNLDGDPALERYDQVTVLLDRQMSNHAVAWWTAYELAPVFAADRGLPERLRETNTTSKRRSKWWYE